MLPLWEGCHAGMDKAGQYCSVFNITPRGEPLGLDVEAAFDAIDHGLGCRNFFAGSRRHPPPR